MALPKGHCPQRPALTALGLPTLGGPQGLMEALMCQPQDPRGKERSGEQCPCVRPLGNSPEASTSHELVTSGPRVPRANVWW